MTQHKNLLIKIFRKVCHSLSQSSFLSSNFRIFFLRCTGVKIGKNVTINQFLIVTCEIGCEENLTIEDRVAFGPNVTLILNSYPNNSNLRKYKEKYPFIEKNGTILIKHDTWIGAGAIVLPNIIVGNCAIVGAGSVVTKNVLPYSIVVGIPAKIIRQISPEEVSQE